MQIITQPLNVCKFEPISFTSKQFTKNAWIICAFGTLEILYEVFKANNFISQHCLQNAG